jgi:hypothetical protein
MLDKSMGSRVAELSSGHFRLGISGPFYGPEYLLPENLVGLRSRFVGAKRPLASRELVSDRRPRTLNSQRAVT